MKKSFTLIELLVVLIIIGILTALAIPAYTKYVEKSRAVEAINMLNALKEGYIAEKLELRTGLRPIIVNIDELGIENVPTSNDSAVQAGQYWYYSIPEAIPHQMGGDPLFDPEIIFRATRSTKDGGSTSQVIDLWYNKKGEVVWCGNHPGCPTQ